MLWSVVCAGLRAGSLLLWMVWRSTLWDSQSQASSPSLVNYEGGFMPKWWVQVWLPLNYLEYALAIAIVACTVSFYIPTYVASLLHWDSFYAGYTMPHVSKVESVCCLQNVSCTYVYEAWTITVWLCDSTYWFNNVATVWSFFWAPTPYYL